MRNSDMRAPLTSESTLQIFHPPSTRAIWSATTVSMGIMNAPVQPAITAPHLILPWLSTYQLATCSALHAGFLRGTCCSRKMKAKVYTTARPIPHHRMARWLRSEKRLRCSDMSLPYFDRGRRDGSLCDQACATSRHGRSKGAAPRTRVLRPDMSKLLSDDRPQKQSPTRSLCRSTTFGVRQDRQAL